MNGTERINGVDLFVRRFGDPSRPTLVVVHGGPGWDHSYLLAAAELQDIAYVVFLDLRGCGRSTREAELQPNLLAVLAGVRFSSAWDRPFLEGRLRPARPADPARAIAGHPVLILHGEHDLAFPVAAARRLAGEVATARLVVVPEAGHMAQFDNPGAWLGAIREFLTA